MRWRCWSLREVDARALRLGVAPGDPRRRMAAVEEAFGRAWKLGRTAFTPQWLEDHSGSVLGAACTVDLGTIVADAVAAGRAVPGKGGLLQGRAAWFMEREVERAVRARLARPRPPMLPEVLEWVFREAAAGGGHPLTPGQRDAVRMVAANRISVLCGGAGTGKTTTVRAVLALADRLAGRQSAGRDAYGQRQVALAGRAARHIAQATGRDAMTIAGFLRRLETGAHRFACGLLVVDEASMVDVPVLYRMLAALPEEVDLLLVGDTGQLPPIGSGSPFHQLAADPAVPRTVLDTVHWQEERTGIPSVAAAVRLGRLPPLPGFDPAAPFAPGVFVRETPRAALAAEALAVFRAMAGAPPPRGRAADLHGLDIQVLCPSKSGPAGLRALNGSIEKEWMAAQAPVPGWGLLIGSKVTWLRNDYCKSPLVDAEGNAVLDPSDGMPRLRGS